MPSSEIAAIREIQNLHKRRWVVVYVILIIDIIITPLIYVSQTINNHNTKLAQQAVRAAQIDTIKHDLAGCLHDNAVANTQIDDRKYTLAKQQKGLEQIKSIPGFNTPQIIALARQSALDDIAESNKFLAGYTLKDCTIYKVP